MLMLTRGTGPHAGLPVASAGAPLGKARSAVIVVHGRGGDAAEMLGLGALVAAPTLACLAPQAGGRTWYPHRFIEPAARNEPDLSSALAVLGGIVDALSEAGIPSRRIALLGFSQGACLALEFAARRAVPFGAVVGLSGGMIGDRVVMPERRDSPLAGMPVLLGCSERDPHIPLGRVRETKAALTALGASVTAQIHRGSGHSITEGDLAVARTMLAPLA